MYPICYVVKDKPWVTALWASVLTTGVRHYARFRWWWRLPELHTSSLHTVNLLCTWELGMWVAILKTLGVFYHQLGRKATSLKMMMQRGWRVWRNRREHKIIVSVETRQCSLTVCGLFLAPRISLLWICPLFYNTKFIQDYLRSWSRRMFLGTWAKWNHITEWMLCKCVPNQQYRRKYGLPTKKHSLQFWLCRQKMKCIEIEAINIITKSALGAPIYNSSTQKVEAGWLLWTWTKLGLYTEALS